MTGPGPGGGAGSGPDSDSDSAASSVWALVEGTAGLTGVTLTRMVGDRGDGSGDGGGGSGVEVIRARMSSPGSTVHVDAYLPVRFTSTDAQTLHDMIGRLVDILDGIVHNAPDAD